MLTFFLPLGELSEAYKELGIGLLIIIVFSCLGAAISYFYDAGKDFDEESQIKKSKTGWTIFAISIAVAIGGVYTFAIAAVVLLFYGIYKSFGTFVDLLKSILGGALIFWKSFDFREMRCFKK